MGVLTIDEASKLGSVTLRLWTQRAVDVLASERRLALVSKLQLVGRADIRCLVRVHCRSHEL